MRTTTKLEQEQTTTRERPTTTTPLVAVTPAKPIGFGGHELQRLFLALNGSFQLSHDILLYVVHDC